MNSIPHPHKDVGCQPTNDFNVPFDGESMFPKPRRACKFFTDDHVPVHVETCSVIADSPLDVSPARPKAQPPGLKADVSIASQSPGCSPTTLCPVSEALINNDVPLQEDHPHFASHSVGSQPRNDDGFTDTGGATREAHIVSHENRIKTVWPEPTESARMKFPRFCELYSTIKATARPNCFAAKIPLESGLVISAWRHELRDYHDKTLCDFLEFGWPLGYHSDVSPDTTDKNHPSGEAFLHHITEFIKKELQHKAVLGPFHQPPFHPWVRFSPIMTRPKRDSDQRQVILDLSYPKGKAVNDGISTENHFGHDISYTLPTITDFAERLVSQGRNAYMWKADLRRAYRQLRADPLDAPLLGMKVGNDIYIDLCPPFGCRSSAAICQKLANALVYIMNKKGYYLLAYLDDFGACYASHTQAQESFRAFVDLTTRLGLSLAEEKSVPPTQVIEWLGYTVNSESMSITIPESKLQDVLEDCRAWLNKSRVNKKTVQAIVGWLVYISNCVLPGWKFTSRILGALRAMGDRQWTTLTPDFKADLRWFVAYAEASNGHFLINPNRPTFDIECDASLLAAGGNSATHCYQWVFASQHKDKYKPIHHLEAINVVVAIRTLLPSAVTPLDIIVWTDNSASAWALQSGRTRDPVLAACAREIWLIASIHNHNITVKHKAGKDIPLADALSRAAFSNEKARIAADLIHQRALVTVKPVLNGYVFFSSFL